MRWVEHHRAYGESRQGGNEEPDQEVSTKDAAESAEGHAWVSPGKVDLPSEATMSG